MKKIITDFLFKKRFKILKSKKGFSLLEVLVAVGIIAIISAIAYPSFTDQREKAARVASETSAANMVKAFKNCIVLNGISACDTLQELKITCPSGSVCTDGVGSGQFCATIKKGNTADGNDFGVCVSVNSSTGAVSRYYGGALMDGYFCHYTESGCDDADNNKKYKTTTACSGSSDTSCQDNSVGTLSGNTDCIIATTGARTCEKATGPVPTCGKTSGECS